MARTALRDPGGAVRSQALSTLAPVGLDTTALAMYRTDPEEGVRAAALAVYAGAAGVRALATVEDATSPDLPLDIRSTAVRMLGRLRADRGFHPRGAAGPRSEPSASHFQHRLGRFSHVRGRSEGTLWSGDVAFFRDPRPGDRLVNASFRVVYIQRYIPTISAEGAMTSRGGRRKQQAGPKGSTMVREAKLFMNGRSQAVRLPADCRFEGDSVYVKKSRGVVILLPRDNAWGPLLESVGSFSPDFMASREQAGAQGRPALDALFEEGE